MRSHDFISLNSSNISVNNNNNNNNNSNNININNNNNNNNSSSRVQKSSRYKGVVPQQNGHWGAQIYANHHRIWLGTFKTEAAAASAYDSAAIKLRPAANGDTHRNFPLTSITAQEPEFQASFTSDQVLNMIKDGSYPNKFGEYLSNISKGLNGDSQTNGNNGDKEGYFCQELFRKELTPSDVGKLNRLVIPKRYAVKFFPKGENEGMNSCFGKDKDNEDLELMFYDKLMKSWSFRYCYWKSSQSFVFTRGWNKFVKDKDLRPKDIVAFYMCVLKGNDGNIVNQFYMIDLVPRNENESQEHHDIITINNNDDNNDDYEDDYVENNSDDDMKEQIRQDHKGFRLFGVNIC